MYFENKCWITNHKLFQIQSQYLTISEDEYFVLALVTLDLITKLVTRKRGNYCKHWRIFEKNLIVWHTCLMGHPLETARC